MTDLPKAHDSTTVDIFCRVIDNFGDAGVMWRLARSLRAKDYAVRLIIDDPVTLTYLAGVKPDCRIENIGAQEHINVIKWDKRWDTGPCPLACADVVIEGFACRLPPDYQAKMQKTRPHWFNIDYFSAEDWIEGCHLMPSIDPQTGLVKTNYFPGVTERSGGLIIEKDYSEHKKLFLKSSSFASDAVKVLFFAYPYGPIDSIAQALAQTDEPIKLSVTQCEAGRLLAKSLKEIDASHVNVHSLPFIAQKDFDKLLWGSDIVFIRGEDSAARAMIAGTPFLWHIYHQDNDVHMVKLKALEKRFEPHFADKTLFDQWCRLQEQMNDGTFDSALFKELVSQLLQWKQASESFAKQLASLGSLSEKLSELFKKL